MLFALIAICLGASLIASIAGAWLKPKKQKTEDNA